MTKEVRREEWIPSFLLSLEKHFVLFLHPTKIIYCLLLNELEDVDFILCFISKMRILFQISIFLHQDISYDFCVFII